MTELKPGDHVLLWNMVNDKPIDYHVGIVRGIIGSSSNERANVHWPSLGELYHNRITSYFTFRLRKVDEEQLALYLLAAL